eukprot:TRINITY_DN69220_c0_g1_i1.p1 TRINITY_DN69220_c0_g1~~TRINITY_DN69220_c0_g1_i1.p1  ORF type:complete len:145 (-),score=28.44 TRINITY_DN69220_c0_g1_i1:47-439(-)
MGRSRSGAGLALALSVALLFVEPRSIDFVPAVCRPGASAAAAVTSAWLLPAAADAASRPPFPKPFFADWPAYQQVGAGVLIVVAAAAAGAMAMGGEMIDQKTTQARTKLARRRERMSKVIVEEVSKARKK